MAAGDRDALAQLYDRTRTLVYGLTRQLLRDEGLAEEATLDAFTQAWREADRFDATRGSALSWLLNMARSRAIDRQRQAHGAIRRKEAPLELAQAAPAPDAAPLEASAAGERRERVVAALASLPSEQREAVHCAFFLGMSHAEVALHLQAPLGTVKTRIRTGLMRLRQQLEGLAAPT